MAILLRWLLKPETRDFALADLTVVTAMVGAEWRDTGNDFEKRTVTISRTWRPIRAGGEKRSSRQTLTSNDGLRLAGIGLLHEFRCFADEHFLLSGRHKAPQTHDVSGH